MPRCLLCDGDQVLVVYLSQRGTPHDGVVPGFVKTPAGGHNFIFDYEVVFACSACGDGELRVFSHDCFAPRWDEEWDMTWSSVLPGEDLGRLREGLATCPAPDDPSCSCAVHESLKASRKWKQGTLLPDGELWRKVERGRMHIELSDAGLPRFS